MLNKRVAKVAAASIFVVLFLTSSYLASLVHLEIPVALLNPTHTRAHDTNRTSTAGGRGVLVKYNFTPPAIESAFSWLSSSTNTTSAGAHRRRARKPIPVEIMEQYIAWHSVESLRQDPHNRRFSVVYFSCPVEAGNRLHQYLSGKCHLLVA